MATRRASTPRTTARGRRSASSSAPCRTSTPAATRRTRGLGSSRGMPTQRRPTTARWSTMRTAGPTPSALSSRARARRCTPSTPPALSAPCESPGCTTGAGRGARHPLMHSLMRAPSLAALGCAAEAAAAAGPCGGGGGDAPSCAALTSGALGGGLPSQDHERPCGVLRADAGRGLRAHRRRAPGDRLPHGHALLRACGGYADRLAGSGLVVRRGRDPGESRRLLVESPWSQFTSERRRF
jgi:hypothetical protein